MLFLAALFGWVMGVGINLLADTLPMSRRVEQPHCPACGAPRTMLQISGLTGLLLGQRNCAYCDTARKHRSWVIELIAIGISVLLCLHLPAWNQFLPEAAILVLYGLITVIDLEHRLILHVVSLPSIVIIALLRGMNAEIGWAKTLWGGLAGLLILLLFYLVGDLFTRWMAKRRGKPLDEVVFGFGDVMLGLAIGLDLGWSGVILALFVGILAAGLYSLILIIVQLIRGKYSAFMAIPYGPFLIFGAVWFHYGGKALIQAFFS